MNPPAVESSDEPVGGVGVLREHDRLLAVARLDPVCAEAGQDERVPLRHRKPGVGQERLETSEQTVDLLALLLRRLGRLDDDLRLLRLGRVVSVRVRLQRRRCGHRATHPVPAALESLRERVQAGRSSLAVDHAAERDRVRGEEPVDEVERLSVEVGLGRVERHGLVRRPSPLEELGDPVEVDEVLLHASQEVHATRFRRVSGFLVGGDRRVDVGVDEVEESAEQPFLAAVRCCGHEQSARGVQREQFARLVVRRGSRREPVRLVEHDRVPAGSVRMDRSLHGGIYRCQIQAHNPQVVIGFERVLAHGLSCDRAEAAAKEPLEVSLPFRDQVSRGDNKGAADEAEPLHLPQVHPGHDRLARSGLVREQEPEVRLREHRAVNSVHLMGVRLERRRRERCGPRPRSGGPHPRRPQSGEHCRRGAAPVLGKGLARHRLLSRQLDLLEATRQAPRRRAASRRRLASRARSGRTRASPDAAGSARGYLARRSWQASYAPDLVKKLKPAPASRRS